MSLDLKKFAKRRQDVLEERKREGEASPYMSASIDRYTATPAFDLSSAPLPGAALIKVNIHDIAPAPSDWNFFDTQSEDSIMTLAVSMLSEGQFAPIIIREQRAEKRWQCLAGHTRVRAAQFLVSIGYTDWQQIYAFAYPLNSCDDTQAQRIVVYSNTEQRVNMTPRERQACFYFEYCDAINSNRHEFAKEVMEKLMDKYQIKRSQAFNLLSIGKNLIPDFGAMLKRGSISIRSAIVLSKMDAELQQWLFQTFLDKLDKDTINAIAKKTKAEIIEYFNQPPAPSPDPYAPQLYKKVTGGKLARVFVPDGMEKRFLAMMKKLTNPKNK